MLKKAIPFLLLGLYLLPAIWLTRPILKNNVLPGENLDGALPLWAISLPTYSRDFIETDAVMYPMEHHWLPLLSPPTSAIYFALSKFVGTWAGFNGLFPLYLALIGWLSCLWLRRWAESNPSPESPPHAWGGGRGWGLLAICGGLVMAFNPITYQLMQQGAIGLLGFFSIPLALLVIDWFAGQPKIWRGLVLIAVLYGAVLLSIQFLNLLLTLLLPYLLYRMTSPPTPSPLMGRGSRGEVSQRVPFILGSGVILLILLAIYPGFDLGNLETWQGAHLIYGADWQYFWIGGLMLVLIVAWWLRWSDHPTLPIWAALFGLHALLFWRSQFAPTALLGADVTQRLPYLLAALLCALPIILRALASLARPSYRVALGAAGVLAIFLISGWQKPFLITEFTPYNFYAPLADENYTLIDFPVAADSLARRTLNRQNLDASAYVTFSFDALAGQTMVYAPQHQQRVVGGLANTLTDVAFYQDVPVMRLLTFQSTADLYDTVPQLGAGLRAQFRDWNVGYIVLHPSLNIPPDFVEALRDWLRWTNTFCMVAQDQGAELWRTSWHPAGCPSPTVEMGDYIADLAIDGYEYSWYDMEYWTEGGIRWAGTIRTSKITLWAKNPDQDQRLIIRALAPVELGTQTVSIVVNGQPVGEMVFGETFSDQSVVIPESAINADGMVLVELHHATSVEVDGRLLRAAYQRFTLEPPIR